MWKETRVSETLNITYPIIQGPFGSGLSSVSLLAAVSNAGGLGSFGAHHLDDVEIEKLIGDCRNHTQKSFAINLWVSDQDDNGLHLSREDFDNAYSVLEPYFLELGLEKPDYPEKFGQSFDKQIEGLLRALPPVFSFVYGIPDDEILKECRKRKIITIGTAITVDEAVSLDEAGVDLIVASGFEAGGHRIAFEKEAEKSLLGTLALIPQVVDNVKAPVIAAGGIADYRGIKAAFGLGADAVQIGTAFLACKESNAPALHKEILFSEEAKNTQLTRAFTGRLARGVENRIMQDLENNHSNFAPYPAQAWFSAFLKKAAIDQKRTDLMSLWAGQSAPLLKYNDATELFYSFVEEM